MYQKPEKGGLEMTEKRAPRNTASEVSKNPLGFILEAMVGGQSQAIERQEARGQRDLLNSTTLPTDLGDNKTRAILEKAGVKFIGPVEGDDIFQHVELPDGWKKAGTEHPMWSKLVDEKGRERAAIFYKAAFYDRSAHLSLTSRYRIDMDYDRLKKENVVIAYIKDGEQIIHTTEPKGFSDKNSPERFELTEQTRSEAANWLKTNFPDWQNPGAYWD